MTARYPALPALLLAALFLAGCSSPPSATDTYVLSPGQPAGNRVSAQQQPPVTRQERTQAAETLGQMERALAAQRGQQADLDRKVDEIRKQLYEAALAIRDIKNRADAVVGLQSTNAAVIVMLEDEIRKQRSMLAQMEQQLAASPRELTQVREALLREQRQRERDQAVAKEREKEIADLRAALRARDDMLKRSRSGAAPATAAAAEPPVAAPASPAPAPAPVKREDAAGSGIKLVAEGNSLLRQGKVAEAERTFQRALGAEPGLLGARIGIAACAYTRDDLISAKDLLASILREDKDNAQALGLRGIIHWREGELRDAQDAVTRALKLDPRDAQLHNYLGIILHARKRLDEAQEEMRKAVELDPGNAEARFNLAVLLATGRSPQLDEARQHYETALAMGNVRDPALDKILYRNQTPPGSGTGAKE